MDAVFSPEIRQIVFDCDGVLLESVHIKTLAFSRLAEPFGEEARALFVAYHKAHGGVSRMEKFRWLYREVLHEKVNEARIDELARRFNALVLEEICRCPMVPGAREVLEACRGRLPMYVCSGTPQGELVEILQARGLAEYFNGIFGTPPEKAELLRRIVAQSGVEAQHTLMVGDARTDLEAALAVGTQFYARGLELAKDMWPGSHDLTGLAAQF